LQIAYGRSARPFNLLPSAIDVNSALDAAIKSPLALADPNSRAGFVALYVGPSHRGGAADAPLPKQFVVVFARRVTVTQALASCVSFELVQCYD
jgi:hypothetical protein